MFEPWNLVKMEVERYDFQVVGYRQMGNQNICHGDGDALGPKIAGQESFFYLFSLFR